MVGRASEAEREAALLTALLVSVSVFAGMLVIVGALYIGICTLALRGRVDDQTRQALLVGIASQIGAYVFAMAIYLLVFAPLQHEPPGLANPYQGLTRWVVYQQAARSSLFALHGGSLAIATGFAYLLGARFTGRGWLVGLTALGAGIGYVVLTLPVSEFARVCLTGVTLVLRASC